MGSLIELIEEGRQIAVGAGKNVTGFRERCSAWSRKVEAELRDDALGLMRFNNALPIPRIPSGIPFGIADFWQKLQGQMAVLIELAKERKEPEALTLKPGAYGMNLDLKVAWRKLWVWWSK